MSRRRKAPGAFLTPATALSYTHRSWVGTCVPWVGEGEGRNGSPWFRGGPVLYYRSRVGGKTQPVKVSRDACMLRAHPHHRPLRERDSASRGPWLTRWPWHPAQAGQRPGLPGSELRVRLQERVKPARDYLSIWLIRF